MPNRYTYFGERLASFARRENREIAHVSVAVQEANVFLSDVMIYHGGVVNGVRRASSVPGIEAGAAPSPFYSTVESLGMEN
jgi:hypothetical protein